MRFRFFAPIVFVLALCWLPAHALAQQEPAQPEAAAEPPGLTAEQELDALFADLKRQRSRAAANRIAGKIRRLWTDSGSDTVNLLMNWSAKAMRTRDTATAEDLLSQVIVLAPDYAEGWNRRATLYYQKRQFGRSLADIERTLQLEPRHFGALAGLATILSRSGQDRKALETWYRVLALYPANRTAQDQVSELEEKLSGRAS